MRLEYSIFFAKLKVYAPCRIYTIKASSGILDCMDKPSCVKIRDKGPIPPGTYWIKPKEMSKATIYRRMSNFVRGFSDDSSYGSDWGDWRITLHPDASTDTFGRNGFFIHGGKQKGSKGCIDIGGGDYGNKLTDQLYKDITSQKFKIKLIVKKK